MPETARRGLLHHVRTAIDALAALSVLVLLIGQLGRLHWVAELFSHFIHAHALALLLAALLGHRRWWWLAGALLLGVWLLLPLHAWRSPSPSHLPSPAWRLVFYNVHIHNPAAQTEAAALLQQNAEVLALAEIDLDNPGWQALRQTHPHGCAHRERSPFALALWSSQPLRDCQVHFSHGFAWIHAERADGMVLYALHPPPPMTAALAHARDGYMDEVSRHMAHQARYLAVGDLNTSPFSPRMRQWLRQAGAQTNTPNALPTWRPYALNIDHALTRRGHPVHVRALPWGFSDHRALLVEVER